jgi:hypothetical protein
MFRLIAVELCIVTKGLSTIPFQLFGPFDTMRWGAWYICKGAHWKVDLWRENGQNALEARSNAWNYHIDMTGHTLSSTIHL